MAFEWDAGKLEDGHATRSDSLYQLHHDQLTLGSRSCNYAALSMHFIVDRPEGLRPPQEAAKLVMWQDTATGSSQMGMVLTVADLEFLEEACREARKRFAGREAEGDAE